MESEIKRLKTENEELRKLLKQQSREANLGRGVSQVAHDLINILTLAQRSARVSLIFVNRLENNFENLAEWIDEPLYEDIVSDPEGGDHLLEEIKVRLHSIVERSNFSMQMMLELNEYARFSKYQVSIKSFNLYALLSEIAGDVSELIQGLEEYGDEKNTNVDIRIDISKTLEVKSDKRKLGRIFFNLIKNGYESALMKKKVSTIEEDYSPQVSVRCSNLEETIEISVIDNGFGIPEEYYQKIFEPFKSYKTRGASTGLGLTIVKDFAGLLKGSVVVESVEGEFASFTLSLPTIKEKTQN